MVAEGVETSEELAYLRANTTIRFAQGYLFAKPLFLHALMPATGIDGGAKRSLALPATA
jgi:sensor c-di-GMP phosphodiesterase-like protein